MFTPTLRCECAPTLRCECAQPASDRLMRKWCIVLLLLSQVSGFIFPSLSPA